MGLGCGLVVEHLLRRCQAPILQKTKNKSSIGFTSKPANSTGLNHFSSFLLNRERSYSSFFYLSVLGEAQLNKRDHSQVPIICANPGQAPQIYATDGG
jgi:hypothetical protein